MMPLAFGRLGVRPLAFDRQHVVLEGHFDVFALDLGQVQLHQHILAGRFHDIDGGHPRRGRERIVAKRGLEHAVQPIDLQGGRVVQLVQGDKLAIASDDLDGWIAKFAKFPKVQLIDLDAAMSRGNNDELVRKIAAKLRRSGDLIFHDWQPGKLVPADTYRLSRKG